MSSYGEYALCCPRDPDLISVIENSRSLAELFPEVSNCRASVGVERSDEEGGAPIPQTFSGRFACEPND